MPRNKAAAAAPRRGPKPGSWRRSNAERSAYFARREASRVLRTVLHGDAKRRAVGSIKSLVYSPSVRNKKATFALLCQTLKYLAIIKEVLESANVLNSKWKRQEELIYIIAYDILFGQDVPLVGGDAEKFLMHRKVALQVALARLMVRNKVKCVDELVSLYQTYGFERPCYVRVNTLKLDVDSALLELGKDFQVQKDDLVPNLLVLPPHSDLHCHPLLLNGSIFVQGKASSMVAAALNPKPGWEVLDACSAPGNKTVHLAALMQGEGRIIACELNKDRIRRLEDTVRLSGASILHDDFLNLDLEDPSFAKVSAILLDPSCSGSGTITQRLDHLLPSHNASFADTERLNKLAAFQKKALAHALSFPAVKKVVYSTCSINQVENEDVVASVLPLAKSQGFQLVAPFPQWKRRGLPVVQDSDLLLRMDPVEDMEGFFIALFVKNGSVGSADNISYATKICKSPTHFKGKKNHIQKRRSLKPLACCRLSRALIYSNISRKRFVFRNPM